MKVIFLDVDGVLNCIASTSRCDGFIGVDNSKIAILKLIVDKTGANIVLTSSWKEGWNQDKEKQSSGGNYLDRKLAKFGLYIIDKTDDNLEDRGIGIIRWISNHDVESYVILDDERFDYDELGLLNKLVKTSFYDPRGGLQNKHMDKAIQILNSVSI